MKNFRNSIKVLSLCAASALIHSSIANAAITSSIPQFEERINSGQSDELTISINEVDRQEWRVGDSIKLHVTSKNDCELQMVHLDSNGVASVFNLGMIKANEKAEFPKGSDFMTVQPPLGQDNIYAACSGAPLPKMEQLAVSNIDGVVEAADVKEFAQQYINALDTDARIAKLSFKVKGRDETLALISDDIVDFYVSRSRTIQRPKLDLAVNFEYRSAELTDDAMVLLNEVGKALNNQKMLGAKFDLNGHTDDIGSENYNMSLSAQRAHAVGEYLKRSHSIEGHRVVPKGYGESYPKVENINDENRAENRRVEFVLSR